MLLSEFLDQLNPTESEFLALHPQPALLIEPFGVKAPAGVDTPSEAFKVGPGLYGESTEVLSPLTVQRELSKPADFLDPNTRLEWLKKTERNPFANLITVGRARNNDIVLEHTSVSKLHLNFTRIDDEWFVQDGRSKNGTFVNGVRLGAGAKQELSDGDLVGIGGELKARFFSAEPLYMFLRQLRG